MRTALTLSDLDYRFLATTPLFAGIAEQDIQAKLVALGAVIRSYPKGAFIHLEGDRVHTMSLVLRGRVHIEHDDVWGNRALLGQAETGDLFAEAYAAMGDEPLLIHVVAAEDTDVLCLDVARILTIPAGQHWEYPRLTANLLHILARKNYPCRAACCTRRPKRSAAASCPICPFWRQRPKAAVSPSPSTASRWPITWGSTGRP